ncbi:hypothetical protein V1264_006626 [Littorina saxatilis]|uniref:Uncharacterized protein n=1 Tax=Littorina saxatilis TaxID=31220 RepID=A0AAN9AY93_9CAEN
MKFWRRQVEEWYPQLQQRTYFVPPVFMNRTGERVVKIYGTEVLVKQRPVDDVPQGAGPVLFNSDVREDRSQQNVLKCLRKVSEAGQEVMFVLSQLNFKDYLPCYSAAAASKLPTPKDFKADNKDQGDFDVLVLHRHLGILVGEIKALGDNFQELGLSQQQQEQEVVKKVKSALKQLDKADDVLSHLTQDLQLSPRIVKSLMLPNVPAALLRQALDSNPPLKQAVCQCLDLPPTADPTPHCMTSDDLDSPETWWQQRMKANGDDPAMKDKSVYLDLVSRFCGPATMVSVFCSSDPRLGHQPDVRTEGEGVSETGHRFTRFMVTPSQLTVLHVSPPWAFLVGPPGTGKTFVLILKALDWIRKGEPVLVFSTSEQSEGASRMIYHQLEQTLVDQAERSRLHFEQLDLWNTEQDVPKAVASILQKARQGILNIIADEAFTSKYVFDSLLIC